jgi:hypothetical protein
LKKIFKDPLAQFLLAGLVLFVFLSYVSKDETRSNEIVVDREALLTFIQYRTKVFRKDVAAKRLDAMTGSAREQLVADYIQEEAMYRESKSLGLEGDDYVIRRRMVQKLEFITQGFVEQELPKSDSAMEAYFQENLSDYYIDGSITFSHVFLSNKNIQPESRIKEAQELKDVLISSDVHISAATQYGERFPFHVNYVEKTADFIGSHFGKEFAVAVFEISPTEKNTWHGPLVSEYGLHLVNVKQNLAGRSPELSEVKGMVEQDYHQHVLRQEQQKAYAKIVEQYHVIIR